MTCVGFLGRNVRRPSPREQSGVVLFIALMVMVALSLSGIALIRSTDTGTTVTGNLAFKQASITAIDRGIESAVNALWYSSMDTGADHPEQNYYACVRNADGSACVAPSTNANSAIPERPDAITSVAKLTGAGLSTTLVPTDAAGNKVYYVIERMCLAIGRATAIDCNVPAGSPSAAFYRLTARVEGPRDTVTYAQAILRDQIPGASAKHRVSWRILND